MLIGVVVLIGSADVVAASNGLVAGLLAGLVVVLVALVGWVGRRGHRQVAAMTAGGRRTAAPMGDDTTERGAEPVGDATADPTDDPTDDTVIDLRDSGPGEGGVVIRRVVVGENGGHEHRADVRFDETASGLAVGPTLRLRHRIDAALAEAGLPPRSTTVVLVATDRAGVDGGPARHGLVAFATDDDPSRAFRDWFTIDTGAFPELPVTAGTELGLVIDLVAVAVGEEARRAGPVVPAGQTLARPGDRLGDVGQALASVLADARWIEPDDDLTDALACVGVVAPFVEGGEQAGVQLVMAAVSDHLSPGVRVARQVVVSTIHEMLVELPTPELAMGHDAGG